MTSSYMVESLLFLSVNIIFILYMLAIRDLKRVEKEKKMLIDELERVADFVKVAEDLVSESQKIVQAFDVIKGDDLKIYGIEKFYLHQN